MVPERYQPPSVNPSADRAAEMAWGALVENKLRISLASEEAGRARFAFVLFVAMRVCMHFIAMERGQATLLPG